MRLPVVYPVRPGDANEELRFSLRTLQANYPDHGPVWIVGYKPNWVTNVEFIPGNSYGAPHWNHNVYRNILAAAEHPDIPDEFLVMNDDFFITQPVADIPIQYWGSLVKQCSGIRNKPTTWWHRSLLFTLDTLQHDGYPNPISYEIHCPLPVNKANMAGALRRFVGVHQNGIPVQWRTVYGVLNTIGGTQAKDCKARHRGGPILKPFHSTADASFRFYRPHFQQHYPKPSRYEKA